MKKLFGLGRGLQSLIPKNKSFASTVKLKQDNVFYVETSKIKPNENQPRRAFDKVSLQELADSIRRYGILQPLLVSKKENETNRGIDITYEILAGERRWRAAQIAGMPHVPVIVKDHFDEDKMKLEVALVENIQRENLSSLEEAYAYSRLAKDFGLKQRDIAERVGKSREVIANTIRLLDLPENIKLALSEGVISRTHARTLLAFKDLNEQQKAFRDIVENKIAVHAVERVAKEKTDVGKKAQGFVNKKFEELQSNLAKNLNLPVLVKETRAGGKIEIRFTTLEELNSVVKSILG